VSVGTWPTFEGGALALWHHSGAATALTDMQNMTNTTVPSVSLTFHHFPYSILYSAMDKHLKVKVSDDCYSVC